MNIRRLEVAPDLPISVAAAKRALRIDHAFEDDVIERKLRASIELVEVRTTRILRPTTFEATFDGWPCYASELCLDALPIRTVSSVDYIAEGSSTRTAVSSALYDWRKVANGGQVYFFSAFDGPAVSSDRRGPIAITFEAGYDLTGSEGAGDDPELALPDRIVELVLLVAGHWFKHREAVTEGDLAEVPMSADLLFKELRVFR